MGLGRQPPHALQMCLQGFKVMCWLPRSTRHGTTMNVLSPAHTPTPPDSIQVSDSFCS